MHHHIAGKRYGEVIAEALLTEFCCEMEGISLLQLLVGDFTEEVARVEYLEEQLVALLAVLTHQCAERFHSRCFYLLEAIKLIHLLDGIKDIVATGHL